jgi:AraC-like DNA-binding protein
MDPASSVESFHAERFGRWFGGRHFIVWSSDPSLGGGVAWGSPNDADVDLLARALGFELDPERDVPFDIIVDGHRLEGFTGDVFERFTRDVGPVFLKNQQLIKRVAVVAPPGLFGAVLLGTPPSMGANHAWRAFAEPAEAYAWLGRPEMHERVELIVGVATGLTQLLEPLRQWLLLHLEHPILAEAARSLGRSARTLQRELTDAGTSFRGELEAVRVELARQLLHEEELKLEVIAQRVGCTSPSAFSAMFARATGESPSDFRARHRR